MKKLLNFKWYKGIVGLFIATIFLGNTTTAFADTVNFSWQQFRGNNNMPAITDSKTPINKGEMTEKWSNTLSTNWSQSAGNPIIVGDYIYIPVGNTIKKINKETGKIVASGNMADKIGFFSYIAYGDGKVFVPIDKGRVQAFDGETLKSLWISKETPKEMYAQSLATVIYKNGHIYTGVTSGGADKGMYFSLSTKDEDPSRGDEIKDYTWTYEPKEGPKGYYWSGGLALDNSIVFGGEAGEIVSHSYTKDKVIDKINVNGAIRSTIAYDNKTSRIYVGTKSGNLVSVKINEDGTFDKSTLITKNIGGDITSSPVVYNGRVYIAGGGISSGSGFTVLNSKNLNVIYNISGVKSQSSPILTTAYGNQENKNTVYLYAFNYSNPDKIYCIKDFEGNTSPSYEVLGTPSKPQYNSSSAAVDKDGTIYFKNDSNTLFAFSNKNGKYIAKDVENAIDRLENPISIEDKVEVQRARARYNELSESEKNKVSNISELNKAEKELEDLINGKGEVESIIKDINNLPEKITLANKDDVNKLYSRYKKLADVNKDKVTNKEKLLEAKKTVDKLQIEKDGKDLEEKIGKLPKELSLDNEKEVNNLYKEFNNSKEEVKDLVKNKEELIKAKEKIDSLRKNVDSINDDIWNKINPSNITLKDKDTVYDIVNRYNALSDKDKKYVKYYEDVLDALDQIKKLEGENGNGGTTVKPDNGSGNKKPGNTNGNSSNSQKDKTEGSVIPATGNTTSIYFVIGGVVVILGGVLLLKKFKK